jgi:hypothetical protein
MNAAASNIRITTEKIFFITIKNKGLQQRAALTKYQMAVA